MRIGGNTEESQSGRVWRKKKKKKKGLKERIERGKGGE